MGNDPVIAAEAVRVPPRRRAARYAGRPYQPSNSPNPDLIDRLWTFAEEECLSCRDDEEFARLKEAIAECLNGVEGEHESSIGSPPTLDFRASEGLRLPAGWSRARARQLTARGGAVATLASSGS